jgi:hypothetical protein
MAKVVVNSWIPSSAFPIKKQQWVAVIARTSATGRSKRRVAEPASFLWNELR